MGAVNDVSRNQIRAVISSKHKTLESCKEVLNIETFEGFSEDFFAWSVNFFKKKYPKDHPGYEQISFAHDICRKRQEEFVELAKVTITKAISDLELKVDRELYLDLISFLIYREMEEGK